jgi:light-regulated signal transduction histidine kinase (bacteriophytochrome)
MKVNVMERPVITPVEYDYKNEKELLFDLSLVVLECSNDDYNRYKKELDSKKEELIQLSDKLKAIKQTLITKGKLYNKTVLINSILNKVIILKNEGQLVGNNRKKILDMLVRIETQPMHKLQSIDDKLSIHVPSIPKVMFG